MRVQFLLLTATLSVLLISPAFLERWYWRDGQFKAAWGSIRFVPVKTPALDLTGDGFAETWGLSEGRLSVRGENNLSWASPETWNVQKALATDLDRNGDPELTLLVWRPFADWMVDAFLPHGGRISGFHDARNRSCHLILIGWSRGDFREIWAGSPMVQPALDIYPADWDGDGLDEVLVIEGEYELGKQPVSAALWAWNGFGFSLEGRRMIADGNYLVAEDGSGRPVFLSGSGRVPQRT